MTTETQRWARSSASAQRSRRVDRAFDVYRTLVWVYGGFLLGLLVHARWAGDDLLFWPWSSAFLLLLLALVVWQRRRSQGSAARSGDGG